MPANRHRFLGLAFASADLLFEVDPQGAVTFALGAGAGVGVSELDLVGRSCTTLFELEDVPLVEAALAGLEPGQRKGPLAVRIARGDQPRTRPLVAALSACRLPQLDGRISCALVLRPAGVVAPPASGCDSVLAGLDALEAMLTPVLGIAAAAGQELDLALIELRGLNQALSGLGSPEAEALRRRVAGAIRAESFAGAVAADIGDDRFALLRQTGEKAETLERRLARVVALAAGGEAVLPCAALHRLDAAAPRSKAMKLIRFAIDEFLGQPSAPAAQTAMPGVSPNRDLRGSVQATLARAGAFGALVAERRFELAFQPVIDLNTRALRHYETLLRFEPGRSPFTMIRMAEELDMIEKLDLAVVEQCIRRLQADPTGELKLAVNVSGRTIISPRYVRSVLGLAGSSLKGRLLFEVTESAGIEDLDVAEAHLAAFRTRGFPVCLDDFGAGAASFDYLRRLNVDVVKIDGRYVRELGASPRSDALVRHIVELCRELGVRTVAECVETAEIEAAVTAMGVDDGQGWLFGPPAPLPECYCPPARVSRRAAAVTEWR
jgi:EAL domain-containing protein (putative c-di-GMP-specific phosphodiesterase class I)